MDAAITCCFTGHRPSKLPWGEDQTNPLCLRLRLELAARLQGIYEAGYRHFICGMAVGCDLYFAEAVLALRQRCPDLTLEAAVPCRGQEKSWSEPQQQRYRELLAQCDSVTVLQESYSSGCMQRRNRYMVERSSLLLACFNGSPGGTMNTILLARRRGCRIVTIELDALLAT